MKTAFVTGATGFVGINLVIELMRQGWSVTCLHRGSNGQYLGRHPVQMRLGDLLQQETLFQAVPIGVDAVYHVAANTSSWSRHDTLQTDTNVVGTRNLLEAARRNGARKFIFTSTASAYGRQSEALTEQSPSTAPRSWINYERSKWLAEEEVRAAVRAGLDAVIINPCAVMGPYDTSVWGGVFSIIKAGKLPMIPDGGVVVNHVEEVVRAHIAAVDRGHSGENYILNGEWAAFSTIFHEMARLVDVRLRAPVLPRWLFKTLARVGAGLAEWRGRPPEMTAEMADILCRDNRVSTHKAELELGFRVRPVNEILADAFRWLKSEGLL